MLPNGEPSDFHYKTFSHVLMETLEYFVIDLANYTVRLSPRYQSWMLPAPEGIYLNNSIEPFIVFDGQGYFSHAQLIKDRTQPDIYTFDDVWRTMGPIYNIQGQQVFHATRFLQHACSRFPIFNRSAIHLAFIYIWDYFYALNKQYRPTCNVPNEWLQREQFVQPQFLQRQYSAKDGEFLCSVFDDEENEDLITLLREIQQFIKRDVYHYYRLHLSGTTLTIEKGNDFRVIEYHRLMFSHMDSINDEAYRFS